MQPASQPQGALLHLNAPSEYDLDAMDSAQLHAGRASEARTWWWGAGWVPVAMSGVRATGGRAFSGRADVAADVDLAFRRHNVNVYSVS